jgi:hypothetical protein
VQAQIEALQAAKRSSRPFQTLDERAFNDAGAARAEAFTARKRERNTRRDASDIQRNEAEKRQMAAESDNQRERAEDLRVKTLG